MKISNIIQNLSLPENRSSSIEDYIALIREQNKQLVTMYEDVFDQISPEELQEALQKTPSVFMLLISLYDKTNKLSSLFGGIPYKDGDVLTEELLQRTENKLEHTLNISITEALLMTEILTYLEEETEESSSEKLDYNDPIANIISLLLSMIISSKKEVRPYLCYRKESSGLLEYNDTNIFSDRVSYYENLYNVSKNEDCCLEVRNLYSSSSYTTLIIPGAKVGKYFVSSVAKSYTDDYLYYGNVSQDMSPSVSISFSSVELPVWILIPVYKREDEDSNWEPYFLAYGTYKDHPMNNELLELSIRPDISSIDYIKAKYSVERDLSFELRFKDTEESTPKYLGFDYIYFVTSDDLVLWVDIHNYSPEALTMIGYNEQGIPSYVSVFGKADNYTYDFLGVSTTRKFIKNPVWKES